MIQDQIYHLFPTPLFVCKYPHAYENELNAIKNIEFHKEQLESNSISAQSKNTYILNKPQFKNAKSFIETKLNYFSKEIFKYKTELVITQSWLNLSTNGKSHGRHSHPNSIISGVWYIEIVKDSSPIVFHNSVMREITIDTSDVNEFNGLEYKFMPEKSDIIFFPSNLHHDVPKNESNYRRISLSFNSWPKENFGHEKYLTSTASF